MTDKPLPAMMGRAGDRAGKGERTMELERLNPDFTVCKLAPGTALPLDSSFCFIGKTDEELSLVCPTADTPRNTVAREDGWKGFRIRGTLDFSLVGILSKLSAILAENGIGLFAVSTYNTDYILVKAENFEKATAALRAAGYNVV